MPLSYILSAFMAGTSKEKKRRRRRSIQLIYDAWWSAIADGSDLHHARQLLHYRGEKRRTMLPPKAIQVFPLESPRPMILNSPKLRSNSCRWPDALTVSSSAGDSTSVSLQCFIGFESAVPRILSSRIRHPMLNCRVGGSLRILISIPLIPTPC